MTVAAITLAAAVAAAAILNAQPMHSANDRSRWCTVFSLVERGTYRIDELVANPNWDTIDKVRHEGHFYSTKPPLLPTLVAGVYAALKAVTGRSLMRDGFADPWVTQTILLFVNLLPFVIALAVLARIGRRYSHREGTAPMLVLTAGFAAPWIPFLVTLNNHVPAACCVVFALAPALRIVEDPSSARWWQWSHCGFWAAMASAMDLPAALLGVALFVVLVRRSIRPTLLFFVTAALLPVAAFIFTNWLATGSWKPFYLAFGTEKYVYVHEGVPSYWSQPQGIDRPRDSAFVYLIHMTVGHHGIWSLSPVFVLSLAGWWMWRKTDGPLRTFLGMGAVLTAATLLFYLTRTANYNYGGRTCALRWALWLVPLWLVALVPPLDRWAGSWRLRAAVVPLLAVSAYSAFEPIQNPWQHPWLFRRMEQWGWIDYRERIAVPPEYDPPPVTWFPSLPDADDPRGPHWMEWAGPGFDGRTLRLRAEDAGRTEDGHRRLVFRWHPDSPLERTIVVEIDEQAFRQRRPPAEFVRWPENQSDAESREQTLAFLRGVPILRPYSIGKQRYLHTPLRRDAFACRLAARQVMVDSDAWHRPIRYRTDLWLCPDVPFGVLRVVTTITDPLEDVVLARRTLTAVRASYVPASATVDVAEP